MIAKKEWFKPRILGWGLRPVMWQGWVYIAIAILFVLVALNLPVEERVKLPLLAVVAVVFIIDTLIVMVQMYKNLDERERKHQTIIEANASYVGIVALLVVALYEWIVVKRLNTGLFVVLGAMVLAKTATTFYLWKNE